jgi:endonuclease YncB( thermonuclease family)
VQPNTKRQPNTKVAAQSVLLATFLLAASPAAGDSLRANPQIRPTVLSVGDGDTLTVLDGGHKLVVRLACIDAPELSQRPAGPLAREALQALAPPGSLVSLKVQTKDRYGRTVAEVYRVGDTQPINQTLVRQGHAFVYWPYLHQCEGLSYSEAERTARSHQFGVWGPGLRDGSTLGEGSGHGPGLVRPWDYRACKRNKTCP